jgi:CpeT protein
MTIGTTTIDQDLIQLAQWMAGDFSNRAQAIANPREFAHIHVLFRPLPWDFFGGIGMYSEQVYDYDLWSPYRQGVHRLVAREADIFVENFGLIEPMLYAGSGRERSILQTLTPAAIQPRCGCAMVFRREGGGGPGGGGPGSQAVNQFVGAVEPGKQCLIPKEGKLTYLVSEVTITDATWISRDRGFEVETDEQVWGSEAGQFEFTKIQDFAAEVPV